MTCCQHINHARAMVLGVGFCVCRDCGHRWAEWDLVPKPVRVRK